MKKLCCVALAFALLAAASACWASDRSAWRVGLSYVRPSPSDFRSYDDSVRGVTVEYSLGDTFTDQDVPADASIALEYVRVTYAQDDTSSPPVRHDVGMNVYTLGANIRFGGGAKPGGEGLYAGFGIGVALSSPPTGSPSPSFGGFGSGKNDVAFQWRVLAGLDYAKALFSEVSYMRINQDGVLALTAGMRF